MQFSAKQQGKMRCPLELRLARWHDIAGPNSKPLGRHATVPILQLRPWRPISNILSSTPSSCFSLTSTSAETIESCNGPVLHEKPPATSCSTQVPASIIRRQQTTSSVGASVWVSRFNFGVSRRVGSWTRSVVGSPSAASSNHWRSPWI